MSRKSSVQTVISSLDYESLIQIGTKRAVTMARSDTLILIPDRRGYTLGMEYKDYPCLGIMIALLSPIAISMGEMSVNLPCPCKDAVVWVDSRLHIMVTKYNSLRTLLCAYMLYICP